MLDDGVDLAIRDQEAAGIDVISDGEMRRAGFFTAEFYRHLTGVRALPSDRRLGAGGHDQQHRFEVARARSRRRTASASSRSSSSPGAGPTRPLKVTLPGPYTLSGRLPNGPGEVYATRVAAAEAFVPILRAELRGLVDAGARSSRSTSRRRRSTPTRRRTSRPCSTPRSSRSAAASGSVRTSASATSSAGRWRPRSYRPILRRDARVRRRRARPRVREPRDGRGRHPARDRPMPAATSPSA